MYNRDILRTIIHELKRYIAIIIICALSITMLGGLQAACNDLKVSADQFFTQVHLHDVMIQSSYGLTKDDKKALESLKEVTDVSYHYEETVHTLIDDNSKSVKVKSYYPKQLDCPYLLRGKYPEKENEVCVSVNYVAHSIGETLTLINDNDDLKYEDYIITGIIVDPTDIDSIEGGTSFRSTSTTDYVMYIPYNSFDTDIYTSLTLTTTDNSHSLSHPDTYHNHIQDVLSVIQSDVQSVRETARSDDIKKEALKKIEKEEKKALDKLNEAKEKLDNAKKKLDDAKSKLDKAQKTLNSEKSKTERQLKNAQSKITSGKKQVSEGKKKLASAKSQLTSGEKELKSNKQSLLTQKSSLESSLNTLLKQESMYNYMSDDQKNEYETNKTKLESALTQINNGLSTIATKEKELSTNKTQLEKQEKELLKNEKTLQSSQDTLNKNKEKAEDSFKKAQQEINDGYKEYNDGLKTYNTNYKKYEDERDKALKEIKDAKEDVKKIEKASWYLQTRSYMGGYNNVGSDASAIESLAVIFSIIFLIVALLMCMTTVNRLVDEERSLIGTYQALGMYDREIRRKYMVYALSGGLIGCVIGNIGAFVVFPLIIFRIFHSMYQIPEYTMHYMPLYGIGGSLLLLVCIYGVVYYTCESSLKEMPAILMRPKSPKAGSRVFLERLTILWKRLSFLNKVTARNLFRYKKRLFMTILGIAGCTSLLVTGFGIQDSVNHLIIRQYEDIDYYDYLGITTDNKKYDKFLNNYTFKNRTPLSVQSMTVKGSGDDTLLIQVYIFPDKTDINDYISLYDSSNHKHIDMTSDGLYVSRNVGTILEFKKNDTITLQDMTFSTHTFKVNALIDNYLGNVIYMRESLYNQTFSDFDTNAQMIVYGDIVSKKDKESLKENDYVLSSISTQDLRDSFEDSVVLIRIVVYLITVMAGLLAFVVLFTLSTTNISERERELATIKVLGFYDNEVHLYVNKETMILTSIGIILGIPLGILILHSLTPALKMPGLYFAITIEPHTYVISVVLSIVFALIVNVMTNTTLNRIDPIEALKSVE